MTDIANPPPDAPPVLVSYLALWNELDPSRRTQLIDACISTDCEWVDPQHHHHGREALAQNVTGFRSTFPDAVLGLGSNVDSHRDRHRYEWIIVDGGGEVIMRGSDVVTVDGDGLLCRVEGFFGTLDRHGPDVD